MTSFTTLYYLFYKSTFFRLTSNIYIFTGRVVWEDNELKTENGWGRIVKRKPFGYAYRDHATVEKERDPKFRKVEREPYAGPVIEI